MCSFESALPEGGEVKGVKGVTYVHKLQTERSTRERHTGRMRNFNSKKAAEGKRRRWQSEKKG